MLDHVVHAHVREVEAVPCEVAGEQLRGAPGQEVREGHCDVVRLVDSIVQLRELDVAAVAREDACAKPGKTSHTSVSVLRAR